jgi:hypothetical protein
LEYKWSEGIQAPRIGEQFWLVGCHLGYAHGQRPERWSRSADVVRG